MAKPTTSEPLEVDAVIWRRPNPETGVTRWVAEAELSGTPMSFLVSDVDAWNCDIVNELPVRIRVTGPSSCRILARLRNAKKFVKIRSLKNV